MKKALPLAVLTIILSLALLGCGDEVVDTEDFTVESTVALGSLMALGDGRLQQIADHYHMLAATDDVRSLDWERVRGPLGAVDALAEQALLWFALPDGSYWSVQEGQAAGNLADRGYWPRLLAGETVIGDLVVSRATGRSTAIVAVPLQGSDGAFVGALGSSVFLEVSSEQIKEDMDLQPHQIFFSIDETPLTALNGNPELVFQNPLELDEPELEAAIQEMLASEEGTVTYTFRDQRRTVAYRRSQVTGWWYAFGVLQE